MPVKKQHDDGFLPPPPPETAEVVDMETIRGKCIALEILDRRTVETRFGDRDLTVALVGVEDGSGGKWGFFASYFSRLEIGKKYCGVVAKHQGRSWILEDTADFKRASKAKEALELLQPPF
jgi:hypothetical protein